MYRGLMEALDDPYSEYYTAEELNELTEQTQGIYYGIGAYVSMDSDTNLPKISGVIEGAPAADVDLLPTLEQAGIPTAYFEVSTFEDYLAMLEVCTRVTGRPELYEQYGEQVRAQVDAAVARAEGKEGPSVLYLRATGSSCKVKNSEKQRAGRNAGRAGLCEHRGQRRVSAGGAFHGGHPCGGPGEDLYCDAGQRPGKGAADAASLFRQFSSGRRRNVDALQGRCLTGSISYQGQTFHFWRVRPS